MHDDIKIPGPLVTATPPQLWVYAFVGKPLLETLRRCIPGSMYTGGGIYRSSVPPEPAPSSKEERLAVVRQLLRDYAQMRDKCEATIRKIDSDVASIRGIYPDA